MRPTAAPLFPIALTITITAVAGCPAPGGLDPQAGTWAGASGDDASSCTPGSTACAAGGSSGGDDASGAGAPGDASPQPTFAPVRIACGRTAPVVDAQGNTWSADQSFMGGTAYVQPTLVAVAGTDSPALYDGQRYGQGSAFSYAFAVPPGDYRVTLKFAELYVTGAGERQFDIAIDGTTVESNFDVFARAGGKTALDEMFSVHVDAGQIAIAFTPGAAQNPMVDAIEIDAAGPGGPGGSGSSGGSGDSGGASDAGAPPIVPPIPGAMPGTWQSGDLTAAGMTMHYNFLLPHGYGTAHAYPILLWLHENDMGDAFYDGGDPMSLASYIDGWFNTADFRAAYPCIVIAPYADQRSDPSGETSNFGGWTPPGDHGPNEDAAVAIVQHFIQDYSVDRGKVYVTGASLGGIGSWAMMLDYDAYDGPSGKVFAAGLPFAGVVERYGFGVDPPPDVVSRMQSVPVFAVHGSGDTTSQPNWDRAMWQDYGGGAFPGAPGQRAPDGAFVYLEDPGLGHDVWDTYYPLPAGKPIYDWLFAQRAP